MRSATGAYSPASVTSSCFGTDVPPVAGRNTLYRTNTEIKRRLSREALSLVYVVQWFMSSRASARDLLSRARGWHQVRTEDPSRLLGMTKGAVGITGDARAAAGGARVTGSDVRDAAG